MLRKSPEKVLRIIEGELYWGHINRNGDFVGRTFVPINYCHFSEINNRLALSVPKLYKGLHYTGCAFLLCGRTGDYAKCDLHGETLKVKLPDYVLKPYVAEPPATYYGPYVYDYVTNLITSTKFVRLCGSYLVRSNPKLARRFAAGRNNTRQVLLHILELLRDQEELRLPTFLYGSSGNRRAFIDAIKTYVVDELVGNINTTPYDKQEYL